MSSHFQSSNNPKPRRLCHGNIFVSDLERSMPFYTEICGFSEVFREPGIEMGFLSNGNSHHDLGLMQISKKPRVGRDGHVQIPTGRGSKPGLNHLGFEMENEYDLVHFFERAKTLGADIHRTADHGISHSVYLFDPDGILLEFYADVIEDWRSFYASNENRLVTGDWHPDEGTATATRYYTESFETESHSGAVIKSRRTVQATLVVSDMKRSLEFYTDVVGMNVLSGSAEDGIAVLSGSAGEPSVVLTASVSGAEPGLHHLSFELERQVDLQSTREKLAQLKIDVRPTESSEAPGSILIEDPDGLKLEFFVGGQDASVAAIRQRG